MNKQDLIEKLERDRVLKSAPIKKALDKIDRADFVPEHLLSDAYLDIPLPIGQGQTISQPTTVVFMLELLQPKFGDKILDIGAGSGWVTALLCELTGKKGDVFAYEINEKVGAFGQSNLKKYSYHNYHYQIADAKKHWEKNAPYDKIIAAAAFHPESETLLSLASLLKEDGTALIPTQALELKKITRDKKGDYDIEEYYGFIFVPFQE